MAEVVSLIALDANDLRVFCEVLRFFSIPEKVSLELFLPADLTDTTDLSFPGLVVKPFQTNIPHSAIKKESVPATSYIVFASEKSCQACIAYWRSPLVPVWDLAGFAIADLRGHEAESLLQQRFVDCSNLQVLRSEENLWNEFPEPRPHRTKSFASFIRQQDSEEALATRNGDMLEAWLDTHIQHCFLWYLGRNHTALVLRNPTDDASFNLAYRQFTAFLVALAGNPTCAIVAHSKVRSAFAAVTGSYGFFAEYYDKYMSHVCYNDWLDMIMRWYKKFANKPIERILELACGTANISEQLVYQGYAVDACDLSPFMLHVAERKLFKPNLFRHNMAMPLHVNEHYDLALCLFDSINYLLDVDSIATMLESTYQALKPDSLLIFDISTLMNSQYYFADTIQYTKTRDGYLVHQALYDALTNRQSSHLTLFRKSSDVYHRLEEHHTQRVYRLPEILHLCADTPFTLVGIFSPDSKSNLINRRNTDLDKHYSRLFFVLKKES